MISGRLARPLLAGAIGLTSCGGGRSRGDGSGDPGNGWARALDGSGPVSGLAIAIDRDGDIVVGGAFEGSLAIGSTRLISAGAQDGFVARFDRDGKPRWATRFGGSGADRAVALAVSDAGFAYVAGEFAGAARIGTHDLTAPGTSSGFVAAVSAAGAIGWVTPLPSDDYASPTSIAVSARGDIAVAGYFAGSVSAGGHAVHSAGALDLFAVGLDRTGTPRWIRRAGGTGADVARSIAFGPSGQIAIAGAVADEVDFGGIALTSPAGDTDVLIALLDAGGKPTWVRRFGSVGPDVAHAVAFAGPAIYVAGSFSRRLSFGPSTTLASRGDDGDGFLAQLTIAGDPVWAVRLAGASALAAGGDAVIAAGTRPASGAAQDIWLARLSASGDVAWTRKLGGNDQDAVGALALARDGRLAIVGSFGGSGRFGGQTLEASEAGFVALLGR